MARRTSTAVRSPVASRSIVHSTAGRGPSGQQARRALGEHGRVQRHRAVGQVDGLAAPAHLGVERAARRDDRAEVGDGVVHPEPVAAPGDAQRLVEVLGTRRVDGHQLDVGGVDPPVPRRRRARPPRPPRPARRPGSPSGSANSARTAAKSGDRPRSRCQSHGGSAGSLRAPSARSGLPLGPAQQPRGQLRRRAGDHHRRRPPRSSHARSPSTSRSTGHSGLRPIASQASTSSASSIGPGMSANDGARVEVDGVDPHLAGPHPRHRRRPDHPALHVGDQRRPGRFRQVTHDGGQPVGRGDDVVADLVRRADRALLDVRDPRLGAGVGGGRRSRCAPTAAG